MGIVNLIEHPNWDMQSFRVSHKFLDLACVRNYVGGTEDVIGLRPDGTIQFKVLRNRIDPQLELEALPYFKLAYDPGSAAARKYASGFVRDPKASSVAVGYFEPHRYTPYPTPTAWTRKHCAIYKKMLPYMQEVDRIFSEDEDLTPYYNVQKAAAERTHSEWLIPGTVSTTVTVNQNWRCACHKDDGNLQNGFSAFTCMASNLTGGELIWPRWGVAIQLGFGDVLCGNFHELHCTAPFVPDGDGKLERITCVQYFRHKMQQCGTLEEERDRMKAM